MHYARKSAKICSMDRVEKYENQTFDSEREFYGSDGVTVINCLFDGPNDGESAFKESKDVTALGCTWNLRYPFWHTDGVKLVDTYLTEKCRAALWYSEKIRVDGCRLHGIKALRECADVVIKSSSVLSPEFGWSSRDVRIEETTVESEYFVMRGKSLQFDNFKLDGKYSFQYVEDVTVTNSVLNTKDAFWHAKNVVIKDCLVKGEYLAWYSDNVTFVNCKIVGTQPFCYCTNLKLVDCVMESADLAFEKSSVDATVLSDIVSIKNPISGRIVAKSVGEVILDSPTSCEIKITD